jgi:hypothetical protein
MPGNGDEAAGLLDSNLEEANGAVVVLLDALLLYWMCIPEIAREITSCWISAVPSKMS